MITKRQRQVYDYLRECKDPPTHREIATALNVRSPATVSQHLEALERAGLIRRAKHAQRGVEVVDGAERKPVSRRITERLIRESLINIGRLGMLDEIDRMIDEELAR